jgi:hypothetical protein
MVGTDVSMTWHLGPVLTQHGPAVGIILNELHDLEAGALEA